MKLTLQQWRFQARVIIAKDMATRLAIILVAADDLSHISARAILVALLLGLAEGVKETVAANPPGEVDVNSQLSTLKTP